jgi:hypothetical protein
MKICFVFVLLGSSTHVTSYILFKPSSAKSKLSKINDYERILDDYEEEANNVAFRITAQRLPFWIRALWVYLYDFIGDKRMYEVTWVDDPNRTNTKHIFIEMHSKIYFTEF